MAKIYKSVSYNLGKNSGLFEGNLIVVVHKEKMGIIISFKTLSFSSDCRIKALKTEIRYQLCDFSYGLRLLNSN